MIRYFIPRLTPRRRRYIFRTVIAFITLFIVVNWIGYSKNHVKSIEPHSSSKAKVIPNYTTKSKSTTDALRLEDLWKPIESNIRKYPEEPSVNLEKPVKEKIFKSQSDNDILFAQPNEIHRYELNQENLDNDVEVSAKATLTNDKSLKESVKPDVINQNEKVNPKNVKLELPNQLPNDDSKISARKVHPKRRRIMINEPDGIMKIRPGFGEQGEGVYLEDAEKLQGEASLKKDGFNTFISNMISLKRSIPDTRDEECHDLTYDSNLPSTSVVIIFTNEQWSTLLRTIWSIYLRTPSKYLHEIVLVDDFSDKYFLKEKLDNYIESHFKPLFSIKLIRLMKRSGLIRARLAGARASSGDVLVFLDSHCECNEKWLEPLLQRIKEDRTIVPIPVIDVIDDKTFEYSLGMPGYFQIGGFDWNGHFNWIDIPSREQKRKNQVIDPTRSPTMAGGLFAIERSYFWDIGSYDDGMDVWGGENLEMSFRIWMCGGTLEIIPCSRVGHIFRSFHPYKFPGNKDTHGINTARTVEVWLDDYKRLFYLNRPDLKNADVGSVSSRKNFRKEMKCHDFTWYLKNVYPEKFILDENVLGHGRLFNPNSKVCIDTFGANEDHTFTPYGRRCDNSIRKNQYFAFTQRGEVRTEYSCLEVVYPLHQKDSLRMVPCREKVMDLRKWQHDRRGGALVNVATGLCLQRDQPYPTKANVYKLSVSKCNNGYNQVWWFQNYVGGFGSGMKVE